MRLVDISSSKDLFEEAKPANQSALWKSEHQHTLSYDLTQKSQRRRCRRKGRDIIYYNPLFNSSVRTNIGREFLQIVDHHFGQKQSGENLETGTLSSCPAVVRRESSSQATTHECSRKAAKDRSTKRRSGTARSLERFNAL